MADGLLDDVVVARGTYNCFRALLVHYGLL